MQNLEHGCTPYLKRNFRHDLASMLSCPGPDASDNSLSSPDRPQAARQGLPISSQSQAPVPS